jgi:hypothetical protein
MVVPQEFKDLGERFYQGIDREFGYDPDKIIADVVGSYAKASGQSEERTQARKILKVFFDELLSGKYSDKQLRQIWSKNTTAMSVLVDGNIAPFFKMIRDAL